jgi:hypothetical protein
MNDLTIQNPFCITLDLRKLNTEIEGIIQKNINMLLDNELIIGKSPLM